MKLRMPAGPVAIGVAFALALTGCGESHVTEVAHADAKAPAQPAEDVMIPSGSPKLSQIHVQPAGQEQVPVDEVTAPGKVQVNPNRVSHVVLPVAGRITSVSVKIGDLVERGQTLLTVESPDTDAAISGLQQANAALLQAKASQTKAQADVDRTRDLFEHNATAKKEVLNAESVLAQSQAAVDQAQAVVQQTRRRLEMLGVQPGQFGQAIAVRAPINGKVLEIGVVQGEYRNDTSASLLTVADLSTVWVSAQVPESSIRLIQLGEYIQIEFGAYPNEKFSARVRQIADTVDPTTRTIEVRAELENRGGRFRPEMFCQIHHIDRVERRTVVPVAAVIQEEGQDLVWVERSPGQFHRTPVTLGTRAGAQQAVTAGLAPGDHVVVDGVMLLKAN